MLQNLFGGGLSAQGGAARSGDASAGLTNSFQYNAGFQVTGSGKADQTNRSAMEPSGSAQSNMVLYIAVGVVGLVAIFALVKQ